MGSDMPDSPLNGAERALQQSFRKILIFNGLLVGCAVLAVYWPIHRLPSRRPLLETAVPLQFRPVQLAEPAAPLRLAGAWAVRADDPRFGGLSALLIDGGRLLAVTDRGAVVRFDRPTAPRPQAWLSDLRDGPGPFARKWARDAESLVRDPQGRGWWIGYEQRHSLWLHDASFARARARVDLPSSGWHYNRGAEGLLVSNGRLLVLAENGRDAVRIDPLGPRLLKLHSHADVADAARAPDGSGWVLLRTKGLRGIEQAIAPIEPTDDGYRVGLAWPLPKGVFDNYEGMAIEARPGNRWRFWLVTDDGHRIMARTLLVALDLDVSAGNDKGPARGARPSPKSSAERR